MLFTRKPIGWLLSAAMVDLYLIIILPNGQLLDISGIQLELRNLIAGYYGTLI